VISEAARRSSTRQQRGPSRKKGDKRSGFADFREIPEGAQLMIEDARKLYSGRLAGQGVSREGA